ncbi:MAG TPA: glycosyltransferase [Gaiellaceae bacterium]|nr:glycosyltransferase [Gaiellaceae bacterium]
MGEAEPTPDLQRVARLVILAGVVAAGAYLYFLLSPSHRGTPWVWALAAVAEGLTIFQALTVWWTVIAHGGHRDPADVVAWRERLLAGIDVPPVDVFVTVAGEPLEIVSRTVLAARDMRLPHETWVLDDGRSDELRAFCERTGVGYLRRPDRRHAKAGNVNAALARTSGEFVAIFDADHVPTSDFLVEALPHLVDRRVAFAQSPQWYGNRDHLVPIGASESQRIFYELICPGKNHFNAVFCVGTNVVFRRAALAEVGGLYAESLSEDIWTSLLLHRHGWRSVFVPKVLARGLAPDTLRGYLKQQFRWARGGFELLFTGRLLRGGGLRLDQRLQYLFTSTHYLLAFATLIFQLLPAAFLLLGDAPVRAGFTTWLAFYLPFSLLLLVVTYLQAGGFKIAAIVASLGAAPVHVQAFLSVVLRRSSTWNVTNARGSVQSIELVLPQFALLVVNLLAIGVGVAALTPENRTGTFLAIFWAALQALVLARVVAEAFLDAARQRRELVRPPRQRGRRSEAEFARGA